MVNPQPVLPDYAGACNSNVIPALLGTSETTPRWLPDGLAEADQIVVLLIDGLGWEQLMPRLHLTPAIAGMGRSAITTVAPSTTAVALTSISTGLPPGEHGLVGYRVAVQREVLNLLRWYTPRGDARDSIEPETLQPHDCFGGQRPPVVTRAEFASSGFTRAHLRDVRFCPYRLPSTLAVEVRRLLNAREPFIYAYYDGLDKVTHEYGLGEHYDAELHVVDLLVEHLLSILPRGAALVVLSDHGQVDVDDRVLSPAPEILSMVDFQSGEGRFRWLHAVPGAQEELYEAAVAHHSDVAWVRTREEIILKGWLGPRVTDEAAGRLGDVALVPFEPVAFDDPLDTGPYVLKGRHGSLTSAEMVVPLLSHLA